MASSQRFGRRGRFRAHHLRRSVTLLFVKCAHHLKFSFNRLQNKLLTSCLGGMTSSNMCFSPSVWQVQSRRPTAENWHPNATWTGSWWAELLSNQSLSTSSTHASSKRNNNNKKNKQQLRQRPWLSLYPVVPHCVCTLGLRRHFKKMCKTDQ